MAEKILYYVGAGASASPGALPLARSVGNKPDIPGLAYDLKTIDLTPLRQEIITTDYHRVLNAHKDKFLELSAKADEFGDVDTYAKYLHLMQPGGKELQELKRTLSAYFVFKQTLLKAKDKRYLPWLVSIMNKRTFPDNVKILNWNYDFQVELAAGQIGDSEDIEHSGSGSVYSPSMLSYFPNLDSYFSDHHLLSLIHLNGIAGFARTEAGKSASLFQKQHYGNVESSLLFMEQNNLQSQLHFAWEKSDYHRSLMNHVMNMIERTTIMVVIGYSFPFFNREVDKQVFDKLTEDSSFRKIYYQDPVLNGEQLRAQFGLPEDFDIQHIERSDNFHIPFEY